MKKNKIFLLITLILLLLSVSYAAEISNDTTTSDDTLTKNVQTNTDTQEVEPNVIKEKTKHKEIKIAVENKSIQKNTIKQRKTEISLEDRIPTKISLNYSKTANIGDIITITGQFTDQNNTPLRNINLSYRIDLGDIKIVETDKNGKFLIKHHINTFRKVRFKEYALMSIEVFSPMLSNYLESHYEADIKVYSPKTGSIYSTRFFNPIDEKTEVYGEVRNVTNNKLMSNENIMIRYTSPELDNDIIIYTETNQSGMFKHNIKLTKIGEYTAYLYFKTKNSYYDTDETYFEVRKEREASVEVYKEDRFDDCYVGKGDNLIIYGRIRDDITNKSIPNIKLGSAILTNDPDLDGPEYGIYDSFYEEIPVNATTDKNGEFMIIIPFEQLPRKTSTSNYQVLLYPPNTDKYIIYGGEEEFISILNRTYLKFNKIQNTEYGKNASITGKLTDNINKSIQNAIIKLKINDETVNVTTDNRGIFNYTYKTTKIGKNNITAYYIGNKNHGATLSTTTLHVVKATKLTINKIKNTQYTDTATITGTFQSTSEKPLSATLTININGKKYTTKSDANGTFTLNYKTITPGTNNVTVSYAGNTKYARATTKTTFTVTQKATKIIINKIKNTQYTDNATITGTFKSSSGKPLPGKLTITINNKNYTTKSDANGTFTFNYKTITPGTNNVTVSYAGNAKYKATSTKTTFTVTQKATKIIINKIKNTQYTDNATITGTFKSSSGKPLPGKLTITINNKNYTTKSDANGTFTFNYKTITPGTNNVTVSYAGNAKYKATSTKTTFTVQKQNTIITVGSTKTVPVNKQMSVYGKLTDKDGKDLAYQKITIKVDGKIYTANTTQYGNYNIKITPTTTGTKTITTTYAGTNTYISSTATSTFTVA